MATEMPYEKLNSLQNEIAAHGQNVYMKGCFAPPTFPRAALLRTFARLTELSAPKEYMFGLLFEYFPLAKVNAVSDDATAYRRGLTTNVLAVVYSTEDGEAPMRYARDAAHELVELVAGKEAANVGYGNYSASSARVSVRGLGLTCASLLAGPDSDALVNQGSVPVDKAKLLFRTNYPRLQQIKKKYDPENLFKTGYPRLDLL